ncbi:hypothetical protein B0O99DRAFT_116411 [Bisporella sp. PMI_857]|nr:hypothetical protein B0O99DRAFT_116411 [Bisporella sp. PMI_857]
MAACHPGIMEFKNKDLPLLHTSLNQKDYTPSPTPPSKSPATSFSAGIDRMTQDTGNDGNNETRPLPAPTNITVAEALEYARDSPAGEQDPTVKAVLDRAVDIIWGKIQAQPSAYVMTREEFPVFNYFQNRFRGCEIARSAIARYWNSYQHLRNGA